MSLNPTELSRKATDLAGRVTTELRAVGALVRAGAIGMAAPHHLLRGLRGISRFGAVGGGIVNAAVLHGDEPGLIDDLGTLSFRDLDERSNALADSLAARGLPDGATIGALCRNHRGMLDITFAAAKGGYKLLYLNTDFAAPQARDVCAREGVEMLVVDEEFLPVVDGIDPEFGTVVAWSSELLRDDGFEVLEALIGTGGVEPRPAPARPGAIVILTSGTTGLPKGAPRSQPRSLAAPGAIVSKIPFRSRGTVLIGPPMFHAWGLTTSLIAISTGSTLLLSRRFDASQALDLLAEHKATGMIVVPVMLNRMLSTEDGGPAARDLSHLSFIASSGAQLEAALATATLDAFGEVLHNLYGSTEVAYATIATPEDLRAHPGCVGRPPFGTVVRVIGDDGKEVAHGVTGRIFVGNGLGFEGYTGGGHKEQIDGLMSTGDVGHWDTAGRLLIDGRDDDMIVSGGENVFPSEVEELLAAHPKVLEVSVFGVPDEDLGQRLRAFVVLRHGQELTEEEVRAHVKANLARFKVPKSVTFLDELPRNPTGKVLKRTLREL